MTDDELLAHFASNAPDFQKILPDLTTEEKSSFCKIARIVHDAGLDWYFTDKTDEYFRFGRKNAYDKTAGRQKVLGFMEKKGANAAFRSMQEACRTCRNTRTDTSRLMVTP